MYFSGFIFAAFEIKRSLRTHCQKQYFRTHDAILLLICAIVDLFRKRRNKSPQVLARSNRASQIFEYLYTR